MIHRRFLVFTPIEQPLRKTMLKLTRFLKDYKKECVIGPLFKLLEAVFELIVPVVMAGIIDVGIKNNDDGYIYKMGALMVLLGLLGFACSVTAQYFAAKAATGFGMKLRYSLFAHVCSLSHTELDELGTPSLITRLTADVDQAQSGVNLVLRLFLRSPFIVVGALIMAFAIDSGLSIVFLSVTFLLSAVIYAVMSGSLPYYTRVRKKLDEVALIVRENLIGVRVIRAFSRQNSETAAFERENAGLTKLQNAVGRIAALLNPATYVIVNLGIIAVIRFGGTAVDTGGISQGEIVALVNYMTQILLALVALANLIIVFTKAQASAERIAEVFAVSPSLTDGAGAEEHETPTCAERVVFENVCFAYKGAGAEALSGLTFEVEKGRTLGIIGGTGSGKSTLVHLLARFYDVGSGRILLDGKDVRDYPLTLLRKKIAIVPQKAVLFKGTVRENMQWGKKTASDEEIWAALEIAQAKEVVESKKGGLDAPVLQEGKNFSGGQRQRLTIARALVAKPEVLILDDSSSALDFATDAALRRSLRDKTKGMTVFVVSQRVATVKNADKIVVLDDGKAVGIGTHRELFETCDVYREICLSQLSGKETSP